MLLWVLPVSAAPQCQIDFVGPQDIRIRRVTGRVAEFAPGEPVFVTVTNGGKKYTTKAGRDGRWDVVIHNVPGLTDILCWQGYNNAEDAKQRVIGDSRQG